MHTLMYIAWSRVNDGSNRLCNREKRAKHQNGYVKLENDLDAEHGISDHENKKGYRDSTKSSRNRF